MIILDTNALITLLTSNKSEAEYINLVSFLNQNKEQSLSLPMPAISEFIAGDNNEARSLALLKPNSKFKNLDFDAKSALNAAKVYRDYRSLPKHKKTQTPHQKVKVDIQIIGIALANDVKTIISHDKGISKIVNELGLNLSVFDYMDNNFFEQMHNESIALTNRLQ
ncbi:type II toxin-antitoxin system VapC family toxin [Acinetobacter bereziniae]|uniref:type II toxin-antitoxin system VapC family toxin n=1 Tax=Acinetobacter bereziniae TaxID=106648 RepID=UPI0018DE307E|nr:PIN domain-containing protein [Acinetobacter bereziniae]MBI0393481.1 type II toxin-antitoxin system VapC family toxin [Acinetobacter bereziniae]